ncbi:MAG: xanthan lyase, partial [Bacteroidales bacterium]|nr:xanthan lyase [Bacteroidales bacterium]
SPGLSYYPFREENCRLFRESIVSSLGRKFRKYDIELITNTYRIEQLVPNYFRKDFPVDSSWFQVADREKRILVKKLSAGQPSAGLYGNSIALWNSHGYYYEMSLDRWEFQRAKLFGTVEDVSITGYVLSYLVPMLERAGANVFIPRERDIQTNEVIVDNDRSSDSSLFRLSSGRSLSVVQKGFLLADTIFTGFNPFRKGTSLRVIDDTAIYIPDIPEKGDYAVYVSYPLFRDNTEEALYSVCHTGGETVKVVDQTMGGETWIYLGTFNFDKGRNPGRGSVIVSCNEGASGYLALDAVKFGGGMGNVARRPSGEILKNRPSLSDGTSDPEKNKITVETDHSWKISGMPRFIEASRYWMQYAGMPDTLVYTPNNNRNDYNDDYQSRGLWVNYLMGDPYSPEAKDGRGGLGLPIDLSLAFHSDAGVTPGDSIIGSLAIFYTTVDEGRYSSGVSRMSSRELSDIVQSQIVEDIRRDYEPEWTRRGLWDRPYSEVRRPDVTSMLLELLSHQNLADMKYNIDPRFRFSVSRSIYKGILKYLSFTENRQYVVQPLPVKGFAITLLGGKKIRLSWQPVTEAGEPTSTPDRFMVYSRQGDNGFDNGLLVRDSIFEMELPAYDTIYSFKVTALNNGGESFDSEELSVGINSQSKGNVLVVNGFDRVCGPSWTDNGISGIAWWNDRGVPYHHDIITIGDQYDFDRKNIWLDDDSPGWGASYSDMTGKVVPGNTFNFPYIHGRSIMAAGYSFSSVSDEHFESTGDCAGGSDIIDIIFGEEKSTPFFRDTSRIEFRIYTPEFMEMIRKVTGEGRSVFMSGAYIGSDLLAGKDSTALRFAESTLHFIPRTRHAVRTGKVYATDYARPHFRGFFSFNSGYSPSVYTVEAPDAIEPSGNGAVCAFRYAENNASAGIAFRGGYNNVITGFPFESIPDDKERDMLMNQILEFLSKK